MIVIHPFGTKQTNGTLNAKTYPYWRKLIDLLQATGQEVVMVGVKGDSKLVPDTKLNLPLKELSELLHKCDYWIAIDSFFPHLAHHANKPGVVLWGPSDPLIYGYTYNLNLLKDREKLRKDQFGIWEGYPHSSEVFMTAEEVFNKITEWRAAFK